MSTEPGICGYCQAPVKVIEYGTGRKYGCLNCGREVIEIGPPAPVASDSAIVSEFLERYNNTQDQEAIGDHRIAVAIRGAAAEIHRLEAAHKRIIRDAGRAKRSNWITRADAIEHIMRLAGYAEEALRPNPTDHRPEGSGE